MSGKLEHGEKSRRKTETRARERKRGNERVKRSKGESYVEPRAQRAEMVLRSV